VPSDGKSPEQKKGPEYREYLQSVKTEMGTGRHKGTTKTTVVPDERKDRVAGYQHYHWDGKVSATVTPEPVKIKVNFRPEEG